jgi:hypothetical protein
LEESIKEIEMEQQKQQQQQSDSSKNIDLLNNSGNPTDEESMGKFSYSSQLLVLNSYLLFIFVANLSVYHSLRAFLFNCSCFEFKFQRHYFDKNVLSF